MKKAGQFHFPGAHRHCAVIDCVVSTEIVYDRGPTQEDFPEEVMCMLIKSCPSRKNSSCKCPGLRESMTWSRAWKKVRVTGTQSTWGKVAYDEAVRMEKPNNRNHVGQSGF